MWLPLVALFGLIVPNGLFVHWLLTGYHGVGPMLENQLALSFMLDVLLVLVILCVYFARRPIGPIRWPWFLLLSLLGGLGFSLPLYYWLNHRETSPAGPDPGQA